MGNPHQQLAAFCVLEHDLGRIWAISGHQPGTLLLLQEMEDAIGPVSILRVHMFAKQERLRLQLEAANTRRNSLELLYTYLYYCMHRYNCRRWIAATCLSTRYNPP